MAVRRYRRRTTRRRPRARRPVRRVRRVYKSKYGRVRKVGRRSRRTGGARPRGARRMLMHGGADEDTRAYDPGMTIDFVQAAARRFGPGAFGTNAEQTQGAGVGQYTKMKFNTGRGISRMKALAILDRRQFQTYELQWRRVSPFNATFASLPMPNHTQTAPGVKNRMPCYIWDVTQRDYHVNNTNQFTCHRLSFDQTNNVVVWDGINSEDYTGTTANVPGFTAVKRPEGVNGQGTNGLWIQDQSVLRLVKADFLFRGIASRPTMYKIQFVKMLDDIAVPTANFTVGSAFSDEQQRFWADFIKPCLVNPLTYNPTPVSKNKKMKVLKSYYVKFNPDDTSNKDTIPHQKRVTINFKMSKFCDYRDLTSDPYADVDDINQKDGVMIEDGNVDGEARNQIAESTKRIYMIVTAQVFDRVTGDWNNLEANGSELWPYFDVAIHTFHTVRQEGYNTIK